MVTPKPSAGSSTSDVWLEVQDLLNEGISMGPERFGTTLEDKAAVSRCKDTAARLHPRVEKLRALSGQLGAVSIDDLSACVSCEKGGDEACSRASVALERGTQP